MFSLIAQKSFYAAEDGIHTKHYIKGEKITVNDKEFADLLVKKGETKFEVSVETKVVEPAETKSTKETPKKDTKVGK